MASTMTATQPPPLPSPLNGNHRQPPPLPASHASAAAAPSPANKRLSDPPPPPPPKHVNTAASLPSPMASPMSPTASSHSEKQQKLISEILSTETTYITGLQTLIDLYVKPLRSNPSDYNLKPEVIPTIFLNVESIQGFHQLFLSQLTQASKAEHRPARAIAAVFLKYADFLRMYTTYVNGYEGCLKSLNEHSDNKKFQKFLTEQRNTKATMDLMSYLIMPVQRIPRYELLLKELRRTIEAEKKELLTQHADSHPPITELVQDIAQIDESLTKIQGIAQHVNEQKRKAEHVAALQSVQRKIEDLPKDISDKIFTSDRVMIKEGELQKAGMMRKQRAVFLFDEYLVWCDGKSYRGNLTLHNATVAENRDDSCTFDLQHPEHKTLSLVCSTSAERQLWIQVVSKQIEASKSMEVATNTTDDELQKQRRSMSVDLNGHTSAYPRPLVTRQSMFNLNSINPTRDPSPTTRSASNSVSSTTSQPPTATEQKSEPTVSAEPAAAGSKKHKRGQSSVQWEKNPLKPSSTNSSTTNSANNTLTEQDTLSAVDETSATTSTDTKAATTSPAAKKTSKNGSVDMGTKAKTPKRPTSATASHNRSKGSSGSNGTANALTSKLSKLSIDEGSEQAISTTSNGKPTHTKRPSTAVSKAATTESHITSPTPKHKQVEHQLLPEAYLTETAHALSQLNRNDITALKKLAHAPEPVKLAIESLVILLDMPIDSTLQSHADARWKTVQQLLVKPNFLRLLMDYNAARAPLTETQQADLRKYVENPQLTPAAVSTCSLPAGVLWRWIRAYYAAVGGQTLPTADSASSDSPTKTAEPKAHKLASRPSTAAAATRQSLGSSASTRSLLTPSPSAKKLTTAPSTAGASSVVSPATPKSSLRPQTAAIRTSIGSLKPVSIATRSPAPNGAASPAMPPRSETISSHGSDSKPVKRPVSAAHARSASTMTSSPSAKSLQKVNDENANSSTTAAALDRRVSLKSQPAIAPRENRASLLRAAKAATKETAEAKDAATTDTKPPTARKSLGSRQVSKASLTNS